MTTIGKTTIRTTTKPLTKQERDAIKRAQFTQVEAKITLAVLNMADEAKLTGRQLIGILADIIKNVLRGKNI